MARDFARLYLDIWNDPDWEELSPAAHYLYFILLSHPKMSYAGVTEWRPDKISRKERGRFKVETIRAAAQELQQFAMVYFDEVEEEALIRGLIRREGLMRHPKLCVSVAKGLADVMSKTIRSIVSFEIARIKKEEPDLVAWSRPQVQTILKIQGLDMKTLTLSQDLGQGLAQDSNLGLEIQTSRVENPKPITVTVTSNLKDLSSEVSDETSTEEISLRKDVEDLLDHLDARLRANDVKRIPTRSKKNRDAARLLLDRDGYTPDQVKFIIDRALADEFWRSNILSMSKLREKFETLKAKFRPSTGQSSQQRTTADAIAEMNRPTRPTPQQAVQLAKDSRVLADWISDNGLGSVEGIPVLVEAVEAWKESRSGR